MFVGNIDTSVDEKELYNFFKNDYPSLISTKMIKDPKTHQPKKFGFLYLSDSNEYNNLINYPKPLKLRGKILRIK